MVMQQKIAVPTGQLAADDGALTVVHLEPAGPVRIPNGNFLISAQFERVGDDLLLIGRDGGRVLVVDYFAGSSPPTLVSEYGAEISGDLAEKLAGPSSPGAYAQAGGAAGRPAIGAVEALTGDATALHTDGSRVPLAVGTPVFQGDVVETAPGSRLAIVFNDKTTFTLDSATRMVLDELVYNPGGEGRSAFSLVQGTFVYISGEIAKAAPQNVQIRTPVATVGIRGTEVGFVILGPGDAGGASITVLEGEIAVRNTAGSQVLTAGFAVSVSSTFAAPSAPIATPLSNIISQYGALRGYGSNAINNSIIRLQRDQQQLQLQAPPAPGHGTGPVTGGMRAASGQAGSSQGEAGQAKQGEQAAALAGIAPAAGQAGEAAAGTTTTGSIFGPSALIAGPAGLVSVGALISLGTIAQNGQLATLDHTRLVTTGDHRVTPAAAAPSALVAVPDQSASTPGNGTMQIDVLANDTTPPTGGITIVAVDTTNTLGSVTINPSGTSVTYSPGNAFQSLGAGQTATDTFTYTIADASGVQSTATVTVTVTGVNDPPVAADDAVAAVAGGPTEILPLANDTDPDNGDSKTIVAVGTAGTLGSVTVTGGGTAISYDPGSAFQSLGAGQTATDTFTYTMADSAGAQSTATVTVSIVGANDVPTAVDDVATAAAGDSITIAALSNDTDPDNGDSKTIVSFNATGTLGSVQLTGGGSALSYSTDSAFQSLGAGQTATDSFTYTMRDAANATSTATVTVTITGVNDAPTAVNDVATVVSGGVVTIAALANDTDPDIGDSKEIVTVDATGTLGAVGFSVGGGITYSSGTAFRSLGAGQTATDSFTYTMRDAAGAQATATVTVTVTGINDAPTDITLSGSTVAENAAIGTLVGTVAATDADAGDSITFSLIDNAGGAFVLDGNAIRVAGAIDYEASTTRQITIRATDAAGAFYDETLSIAVTNVNEAPSITSNGGGASAAITMLEATTAVTTVAATDPDSGTTFTFSIVGGADASHFAINSTGELTFFPPPIFEVPTDAGGNNIYDVTVQVSDGSLTDTQAISVTVTDDPNVDPNDFDYLGLPGTQVLTGSGGSNDLFYGGAGNDVIDGHTGGDTIYGGSGADLITASGDDPDLIFGGSGNDRIEAGQSGDTLIGGLGNDTLQGGQGNDVLEGSAGNDSITGGQGADRIVGGTGADIMDGGQGADQFVFNGLADVTVIASNQTAAQAGLPINSILDFDSGVDSLVFNSAVFSPDAPLVLIGGAYDGTSSVIPAGPAFVLDGNGLLSYDPDVATEGYVAVAQLGDAGLEGPDLQFSPSST